MAQLTWRNIDAPNIDTRGLAVASAGITGGFDRLATMLNDRELMLRERATNDAAANLLAIQDPEQLKAALAAQAMGDPNSRVNRREILEVGNKAVGALQERALTQEQLEAAEDPQKYGLAYVALANAQRSGDPAAIAAAQADLVGARNIIGAADKGIGWLDQDKDNTRSDATLSENIRSNKASEADRAASRALQAQGLALQRRAQAMAERRESSLGEANRFGMGKGEQFASMTPEDARKSMLRDADFQKLNPTAQQMALAGLEMGHSSYSAPTEADAAGKPGASFNFNKFRGAAAGAKAGAVSERAAAEAAFWEQRPGFDVLRRATTDKKYQAATINDAIEAVDANTIGFGADIDTKAILRDNNLTPGELVAALDQFGGQGTLSNVFKVEGGRAQIREIAEQVKAAKAAGGLAEITTQASQALAPYDRYVSSLDSLSRKAGAYSATRGGELGEDWRALLQEQEARFRDRNKKK